MQIIENAVRRMRGTEDVVDGGGCDADGPRIKQPLEKREGYLVRNGIGLSLKRMMKATGTGRTGLSLQNRDERMLVELFTKEALQSLVECVKSAFW